LNRDAVSADAARPLAYAWSRKLIGVTEDAALHATAIQPTAIEILNRHVAKGRRGLVLCGVSAGAGVTFLTASLGVALSRLGVSTLVVDANLRQPGLEELIAPSGQPRGLRQILSGEVEDAESVVHADVLPGLSLLYAGEPTEVPQDLIGGREFKRCIAACLRNYELTLIDAPPANRSADARRIAATVGYALIVARRNLTIADDLTTLERELTQDGAAVIGSVFNGA